MRPSDNPPTEPVYKINQFKTDKFTTKKNRPLLGKLVVLLNLISIQTENVLP